MCKSRTLVGPNGPNGQDTQKGAEIIGFAHSLEDRDADLSPCSFATAHVVAEGSIDIFLQLPDHSFLTACILLLCLLITLQPWKWRTISQLPS